MLYKKTITLDMFGTMPIMKWMHAHSHKARSLDLTFFKNTIHKDESFICSRLKDKFLIENLKEKISKEGVTIYEATRYYDVFVNCWYLLFNNDVYILTK